MGAKNSAEEKANELLLQGTKPKCYSSVSNSGKNSEVTIPRNRSFSSESKRGGSYIKEEKPDGGWGWLVVFGVALSNQWRISREEFTKAEDDLRLNAKKSNSEMTTQSLISVFGLLFIERLEELGITTKGASLMMGVQTTALNLSGLITGPVINKFSYRKTAVAGALLVMTGLFFTTHADSLPEFIFTYSLLTGLGLGLLYPATFVAIDSYFTKRRGRAVGLSLAGTGIGQMVLPLLVEYLLDVYGFNGTLLILTGIASHSLLGATLYQPAKWHMKRDEALREKNSDEEKAVDGNATVFEPIQNVRKKRRKEGIFGKLARTMNMELMKDASFLNLLICLALVYAANMCFSMLLPFFIESVYISLDSVALCMCVLSSADIIGRLIVPLFTDVFHVKSKTVFFLGAALSAAARSGLMFPHDFGQTLILAGACGLVRAALVCNFNLCISEQTTPEKLPSALGLHMIFKGVAMLAFAPLIGFVRDYSGSYEFCMHVLSVFFLVVPSAAWLLEYIFTKSSSSLKVSPITV